MAKIAEVIKLYPGMSNTVNLSAEFLDPEKNRKRMQGYKPISSHRKIFLKIAKSFLPNQEKVHLFVGQYGTGKSHLLLMIANYFSNSLDMPELKTFFKNFDKADKELSRQVKNLRGEGRYLIVIPDYDSLEDFSENLLSSLEETFKREGVEEKIDSIYLEAIRTIAQWQKDEDSGIDSLRKYSAFIDKLGKESGYYNSIKTLKAGLKDYERAALITFKTIYNNLIGTSFRYSSSNIVDILRDLTKSKSFKERFKGIVFLYDEFDHTLKNRRVSIEVVQQFAELCKNSNSIMFIGSLHKELSSFANDYSVEDFRTVQQRFKTIDMKKDGLEEIASAIVNVKKDHPLYKEQVAPNLPGVYNKVIHLQQLNLLNWLTPQEIREKIIDAVYPLHPLTMACLLELSTTIGSSNRTLFTFLGGEGIDEDNEYSYKSFINTNDILDSNGLLNYYTPDYLVEYFQKELDINNANLRETIKRSVIAYQSSLKEYKSNLSKSDSMFDESNPIFTRIFKLMLVYEIVGIAGNETNLLFGLNLQLIDAKSLKNALKLLTQQKVIFFNKQSQIYEYRRGLDIDWDSVIQTEKELLIKSSNYDLAKDFLNIYKDPNYGSIIDAKKYNSVKSADKNLLRVFESAKNFGKLKQTNDGSTVDYFQYYENQLLNVGSWKDGYDGIVIYVITETAEEIAEAKTIAIKNNSSYIMVVIPEVPIPIKDSFIELLAAIRVKDSDEYKNSPIGDQSRLDENYIGDINKGYVKKYTDQRTKYLSGKLSSWYGIKGNIFDSKPSSEQDPSYRFLIELYNKFNDINDEEINRSHKGLSSSKKLILRDAINHLLEAGQKISIDKSYGNDKGFIRYLKNVLFNKQLLRKTDLNGSIIYCEVEKDTEKYKDTFPALKDMIEEIHNNNSIYLLKFINKYRYAPYGLSEVALELFISFVIKYFGDELAYKQIQNQPGEVLLQSYDQIEQIVNNCGPFAVFEKRILDDVQKGLIQGLYKKFSDNPLTVGITPRAKELSDIIMNWYESQSKISKAEQFYEDTKVKSFLQFVKSDLISDPYSFLFEKLQTVFGYEPDDKLDTKMTDTIFNSIDAILKQISAKKDQVENKIFRGYLEMFGAKGKTFGNLESTISEWYNSLDANQLDTNADWQTKNTQPLVKFLKDTQNLREVIYEKIPGSNDFGLGVISDWSVDNVDAYLSKVKDGLELIGNAKILVDIPIIEVEKGVEDYKSDLDLYVTYDSKTEFRLKVSKPENAKEMWICHEGANPTEKGVQKEVVKNATYIKPSKSHQVIRLVSVDSDGNFSQILQINLKERFIGTVSVNVFGYEINRPKNLEEFKLALKDLLNEVIESDNLNREDLIKILNEIADNLKNET